MANVNVLTYVIPQLLAQGMLALRQMAIMPRYVNRGYETIAGDKGSSIDVPIPSAITAVQVQPSNTPPDDLGAQPTKVSIALDQWWEAPFFLSDKDMMECMAGTIPMQASEAIKSLANKVDTLIISKAETSFYNYTGSAGTVPFATDLSEFLSADQLLNDALAPADNRYMAISSRAKANALGLRQFTDAAFRGDTAGIIRGEIGEKLGAWWFMDQNLSRHTAGTGAGAAYQVNNGAGYAIGTKTVATKGGALGTVIAGDKIKFANHDSTYVVGSSVGGGTVTSITFEPGLTAAVVDSEGITIYASHRQNLCFHRDALALASRPFSGADPLGLGVFRSVVDPVSGLALRLEVTRQHKRTRWSYDILCGVGAPLPQWGVVVAGE